MYNCVAVTRDASSSAATRNITKRHADGMQRLEERGIVQHHTRPAPRAKMSLAAATPQQPRLKSFSRKSRPRNAGRAKIDKKRTACLSKLPQWRNNHSDVFAWRADDNTHKNSAQCSPPTASDVWIAVRIFVYTLLTERSC